MSCRGAANTAGRVQAERQVEPWRMQLDLTGARRPVCPILGQNQDVPFQYKFLTFPLGYQGKWEAEKQL